MPPDFHVTVSFQSFPKDIFGKSKLNRIQSIVIMEKNRTWLNKSRVSLCVDVCNKMLAYLFTRPQRKTNYFKPLAVRKLTCDGRSSCTVPELCRRAAPSRDAARSQTQRASAAPRTEWWTPCQTPVQSLPASAEICTLAATRSPARSTCFNQF